MNFHSGDYNSGIDLVFCSHDISSFIDSFEHSEQQTSSMSYTTDDNNSCGTEDADNNINSQLGLANIQQHQQPTND